MTEGLGENDSGAVLDRHRARRRSARSVERIASPVHAGRIEATFSPAFCGSSSIFSGHGGCLLPRLRACRKGTTGSMKRDRGHAHHHQSFALGIGADALGELYWLPD
jgi:hypothetical protein